MSSNIQIKRVCEQCGKSFLARTTVTRFCSHKCNSRFYKLQQKQKKIESSNAVTRNTILQQEPAADNPTTILSKELLNVKELSVVTIIHRRWTTLNAALVAHSFLLQALRSFSLRRPVLFFYFSLPFYAQPSAQAYDGEG